MGREWGEACRTYVLQNRVNIVVDSELKESCEHFFRFLEIKIILLAKAPVKCFCEPGIAVAGLVETPVHYLLKDKQNVGGFR